jgi:hypothetical protein
MSIGGSTYPLPQELQFKPRSWLEIAGWSLLGASTALIPILISVRAAHRSPTWPIFEMLIAQASFYVWAPVAGISTAAWLVNADAQREAGALAQLNRDRQFVDSLNTSRSRARADSQ